jgi:hypothetical protein
MRPSALLLFSFLSSCALKIARAQAADFSAMKGVVETPGESMQRAFTVQV